MPELNLLTVNPVTAGIESAQRMDAQRQRGQLLDMQVEDARARRAQEQSASQALNDIYAQGGDLSSADVHRRLAADPRVGGTRRLEALQVAEDLANRKTQAEGQARERDARQFKMLLENGMDGAAAEVAKRMGMNIPPDFWTNQAKKRALLEKLDIEDRQAGISQKRASAGASQALAESRRAPQIDEYQDDQGRTVRVDRASGKSTFVVGPDGQPLKQRQPGRPDYRDYDLKDAEGKPAGFERIYADGRRERFQAPDGTQYAPQGGGAGGRPLDREVRFKMLVESGMDENDARRIASGVAMTPQQIAGFRDRAMKRVQTPDPTTGRLQFRTPAEQNAEVERQVRIITGGGEQPAAQPQGAPRQDGGAVPMRDGVPAPRTLDERNALPSGTKYFDPNGNIRVRP